MSDTDYLTHRLQDQIDWYDKKSVGNQKWYKFFQITKIVLAVAIPVLTLVITLDIVLKVTLSVIGALIAIIESVSRLNNYKDLWLKYRMISEALQREKLLFTSQVPPYDKADALHLLVLKCEKLMATENRAWLELQNEKDTEG
ncbi:MAG: DUF4231 domain-containing protein [Bacteroidota bacterium]